MNAITGYLKKPFKSNKDQNNSNIRASDVKQSERISSPQKRDIMTQGGQKNLTNSTRQVIPPLNSCQQRSNSPEYPPNITKCNEYMIASKSTLFEGKPNNQKSRINLKSIDFLEFKNQLQQMNQAIDKIESEFNGNPAKFKQKQPSNLNVKSPRDAYFNHNDSQKSYGQVNQHIQEKMSNFNPSGKSNMRNSGHSHKSTQALNQIKLKGNQPKKDNVMSERAKIMLEPEAEQINHSRISSYHEVQGNLKSEFSRQATRKENMIKISNQHRKR